MKRVHNLILCGGVGSRLWPLSRKSRPKQFIPLFDGKSLFEETIMRNRKICSSLIVVTNYRHFNLVENFLPSDCVSKMIGESVPRNTAAAIAFAALQLPEDDILLVTPSDHLIANQLAYQTAIDKAIQLAEKGKLVTFGIEPYKPETGFGYIEYSDYQVHSFKEKPSFEQAVKFIESGKYLWNTGMFCFKVSSFLAELQKFESEILHTSQKALNAMKDDMIVPEAESLKIPSKSVDYAVMEKSDKVAVIPSSFSWTDLGSYDALSAYMIEKNDDNNNFIFSEKKVVSIDLKNLIIIESNDAILIMPKGASQKVKSVYEKLERDDSNWVS